MYFLFSGISVNKAVEGKTGLEFLYLGSSNNCDTENSVWSDNDKSNQDQGYKYVYLKSEQDIIKNIVSNINPSHKEFKDYYISFDVLIKTMWDYSIKIPYYTLDDKNCQ